MAEQMTRDEFTDYMEAFEQRLAARFARADRRLDGIEGRLDEIDCRFDAIDIRQDAGAGPPPAASTVTARDSAVCGLAPRALEHIDRLNAQVERCTRLLEDLEDRVSPARASTLPMPALPVATPDRRDEKTAFSGAAMDVPADALVGGHTPGTAAPGKRAAPARRKLMKKANGTSVEPPVDGRVIRKSTAARRQRRSRT
jgi:hypothetical protein